MEIFPQNPLFSVSSQKTTAKKPFKKYRKRKFHPKKYGEVRRKVHGDLNPPKHGEITRKYSLFLFLAC